MYTHTRLLRSRLLLTWLLLTLVLPPGVYAQQAPPAASIGTVTALQGQATVGRTALPQPSPLKFRDDVFFRDQITTQAQATVRLLLGGKGVLTIREQSQVTLDETVTATGERRSVLSLLAGKIAAAIARTLMSPGEQVEIRTPNAVAAVRGTVVIAEYVPATPSAATTTPIRLASTDPTFQVAQVPSQGGTSTFVVLTGSVTVTTPGAPPVTVGAMQSVSISVTSAGAVQVGPIQAVSPAQVAQATQGLAQDKPHTGEATGSSTAQVQTQVAAAVATAIVQATTGLPVVTNPTPAPPPSPDIAPVTPSTGSPQTFENVLPAGPLLSLTDLTMGIPAGMSLITLGPGSPTSVAPAALSGTGMDTTIVTLVPGTEVNALGTPVTHSGPLLTLSAAALVGSPDDTTTPLMQVGATAVTNTTDPLLTLAGGSVLTYFGPLLGLQAGAILSIAGGLAADASVIALGPAPAIILPSGSSLTTTGPLLSLTGGSRLTTYQGAPLVAMDPSVLNLSAPVLSLTTNSYATLSGSVLRAVDSTVTGTSTGGLVAIDASELDLTGAPLLDSQNSTLSFAGPMVSVVNAGDTLQSNYSGPLLNLVGGSLTLTGSGALLTAPSSYIYLNGPLLSASGTTIDASGASSPLVSLSASGLELSGNLIDLMNGSTLTLAGGGVWLDNSYLNGYGGAVFSANGATITANGTTAPLVRLTNSAWLDATSLVSLTNGSRLTVSGKGLDVTDSTVTFSGPIFSVTGGSRVTASGGPLVAVNGGSLSALGGYGYSDGTGNQISLNGTQVNASNGAVVTLGSLSGPSGDTITKNAPSGVPLFRFDNATLVSTDPDTFTDLGTNTTTFNGLILIAKT